MSRWLNLQLLLLCFISYIEISTVGTTPRSVTGGKGSSITLPCEFEDRNILDIDLIQFSKIILFCENEECESENGRVFKEGSCDIFIKDLIFSDAGKYFLRVYNTNGQREVERKYHLHIHDEISVKTGEQLKLDVLLINADKVKHQNISSTEWTEVWTRGHGVRRDRMNDSDGKLTINNFTVTDAGTYRVLDYEENILITVTVTVTGSKGKLNTDDDTDQQTVESWIIGLSVSAALVLVLLVLVISALIWKHQHKHRNTEHEPVPMEASVQKSRTSRDDAGYM